MRKELSSHLKRKSGASRISLSIKESFNSVLFVILDVDLLEFYEHYSSTHITSFVSNKKFNHSYK